MTVISPNLSQKPCCLEGGVTDTPPPPLLVAAEFRTVASSANLQSSRLLPSPSPALATMCCWPV